MTPETSKWFSLPPSINGKRRRVLPAYLVEIGTTKTCVLAVAIWVIEVNRVEGWVKYLFPNQPFDVERVARFADVHSKLDSALAAIGRLLPELHALPENSLQDAD